MPKIDEGAIGAKKPLNKSFYGRDHAGRLAEFRAAVSFFAPIGSMPTIAVGQR
jgi:hypothetical protein